MDADYDANIRFNAISEAIAALEAKAENLEWPASQYYSEAADELRKLQQ